MTILLAFVISLCATGLLARLAPRWSWVDAPDLARKKQRRPVPPVGGAGILCAILAVGPLQEKTDL